MRHLLKLALVVLLFTIPAGLFAQAKFGHINTLTLRDGMPEVTTANKRLDTLAKSYQNQMKELTDEYTKKLTDFNSQTGKWPSDAIRDTKAQEIQQLEERIMAFREAANTDITKKTEEFMAPINKKITDAIKAVAKENNYNYVFETAGGQLLYAADSDDITPLVKKKLGIK